MNVEVGDKVRTIVYDYTGNEVISETIYTVLSIPEGESWVDLDHPEIGGFFRFKKERIAEVIRESG